MNIIVTDQRDVASIQADLDDCVDDDLSDGEAEELRALHRRLAQAKQVLLKSVRNVC